MAEVSLVQFYKELKAQPTPAKKLILEIEELTGRKESAIRKWLDGSSRPDASTCSVIEQGMNKTLDTLVVEYYQRCSEPTMAQEFRSKLEEITHKSAVTILRYVQGITMPDALTQSVIAKELKTSVNILFPNL
jgi:hypothetical protein